jgi:hypothetical protein
LATERCRSTDALGEIDQAVGFFQSYLEKAPEDAQYRATAEGLIQQLRPAESEQQD